MTYFKTILIYLSGLFLANCAASGLSSVVTDYDRDAEFSSYQTFYWSDDFQALNEEQSNPLFYNTLIKKRLKTAISSELEGRGYRLDDEDPDLLVNSQVVVEQKSTSRNNYPVSPYFGYYYANYYGTTTTIQKEGGVLIELIDRNRHQLVWQGFAPNVLKTNTEEKEKELRDAVSEIFARYQYRAGTASNRTTGQSN